MPWTVSQPRATSRRRTVLPAPRATTAALTTVLALTTLASCATVDLADLGRQHATPTPTSAYTVPQGMTMPTPLPTAQPTALPDLQVTMPSPTGYAVSASTDPSTAPTAPSGTTPTTGTSARGSATVTSTTWTSTSPLCALRVDITRDTALLLAGGDDLNLTTSWGQATEDAYTQYSEESFEYRTVDNGEEPYTGAATGFTATVLGSHVTGRSFVRAFSQTGTLVSVTQTCSGDSVDEAGWRQALSGLRLSPASDTRWPPTATASAQP